MKLNLTIRPRRRSKQPLRRGAALVETALVLPLILLFMFGIMEYGRYVMTLQVMTNAAREGAHYARAHVNPVTLNGTTYGNATSDVTAIINKALAGQSLQSQSVSVFLSDAQGNNLGTWTNAQNGQSVCVRITGNYRVMIANWLKLPSTLPITARAVMRVEGS